MYVHNCTRSSASTMQFLRFKSGLSRLTGVDACLSHEDFHMRAWEKRKVFQIVRREQNRARWETLAVVNFCQGCQVARHFTYLPTARNYGDCRSSDVKRLLVRFLLPSIPCVPIMILDRLREVGHVRATSLEMAVLLSASSLPPRQSHRDFARGHPHDAYIICSTPRPFRSLFLAVV
jgi:hypothetical protein